MPREPLQYSVPFGIFSVVTAMREAEAFMHRQPHDAVRMEGFSNHCASLAKVFVAKVHVLVVHAVRDAVGAIAGYALRKLCVVAAGRHLVLHNDSAPPRSCVIPELPIGIVQHVNHFFPALRRRR